MSVTLTNLPYMYYYFLVFAVTYNDIYDMLRGIPDTHIYAENGNVHVRPGHVSQYICDIPKFN